MLNKSFVHVNTLGIGSEDRGAYAFPNHSKGTTERGVHVNGSISRRSFLTGTALLGTMAALGTAGLAPAEARADEANKTAGHHPVASETCDLVVVGGGTAGVSAAVRAAQLGANVVLLEKNGKTGGSSYFAEGVGGVNSYIHDTEGLHFEPLEVLARTEEYHHWAADANVLDHYIRASGATINWLHNDCGINFGEATITSPTSYPSWHLLALPDGTLTRVGKGLIEPMTDLAVSLGASVRTLSPATGLIVEDGRVAGVYYEDHNDASHPEHAPYADNVILATGGYARNRDLFEEFTLLDFDRFYNYGAFGATGDGITWARELGAELHNPGTVMYSCTYVPHTQMFEDKINWMFSWQPVLHVNQDGRRFMNEQMATDFSIVSNSVIAQTKAFSVLDHGFLEDVETVALPMGLDSVGYHTGEVLPGVIDALDAGAEKGIVFKSDTIEGLAQQMGVDVQTLAQTVAQYNEYAAAGNDPQFGCPAAAMHPVTRGPFYAAEIQPSIFTAVGGLRVDENWHVLNTQGKRIEGLYALGNDASSQVGRDYDVGVMSGSQQGWCATGGRLAAEDALV